MGSDGNDVNLRVPFNPETVAKPEIHNKHFKDNKLLKLKKRVVKLELYVKWENGTEHRKPVFVKQYHPLQSPNTCEGVV